MSAASYLGTIPSGGTMLRLAQRNYAYAARLEHIHLKLGKPMNICTVAKYDS